LDGEYYWVPGTWVMAPETGYLWTPGYWGWGGDGFMFNEGYWGLSVGFYGGIDYGFDTSVMVMKWPLGERAFLLQHGGEPRGRQLHPQCLQHQSERDG